MSSVTLSALSELVKKSASIFQVGLDDLGASCAFMAMSQSITLGKKIGKGELPASEVPTSVPGEAMALLRDQPGVLAHFKQVAVVAMGIVKALDRPMTLKEMRGHYLFSVGGISDSDQVILVVIWYWCFHRYEKAAQRLSVEEAVLDHFAPELPVNLAECLRGLLDHREVMPLIKA